MWKPPDDTTVHEVPRSELCLDRSLNPPNPSCPRGAPRGLLLGLRGRVERSSWVVLDGEQPPGARVAFALVLPDRESRRLLAHARDQSR